MTAVDQIHYNHCQDRAKIVHESLVIFQEDIKSMKASFPMPIYIEVEGIRFYFDENGRLIETEG